jgi:very-short-patch-repair endonuclease
MGRKTEFARKLRNEMTDAEKRIWFALRGRHFMGLKFRRQHVIVPYIVDFICLELKLIIELDGGQHAFEKSRDTRRTKFLNDQGFQVIRYWNNEVLGNIEGVLTDLGLRVDDIRK